MILAFALTALAAQALPAVGAVRWEELPADEVGRSWIDPASISREGGSTRFLLRVDPFEAQAGGERRLILRMIMDCAGRRIGLVEGDGYDGDGRFIETRRPDAPVYQPLTDSESMAVLYRRMCG